MVTHEDCTPQICRPHHVLFCLFNTACANRKTRLFTPTGKETEGCWGISPPAATHNRPLIALPVSGGSQGSTPPSQQHRLLCIGVSLSRHPQGAESRRSAEEGGSDGRARVTVTHGLAQINPRYREGKKKKISSNFIKCRPANVAGPEIKKKEWRANGGRCAPTGSSPGNKFPINT